MPRDPSGPFNTPSDQAYVAMGAREAGQRWFAFDQSMPAARRGEATRFVMAVWNAPHSPDTPKFSSEAPDLGGQPPIYWYKVPRTRDGVKERNRTGLWNGIRIALRHRMPMHAMLKDHETHRCALRHVYEIAHVHYPLDGEAVWLGLNPVDSDAPVLAGASSPLPVETDLRVQAPSEPDNDGDWLIDEDELSPSDVALNPPWQEHEEAKPGASGLASLAAAQPQAAGDHAAVFEPTSDVRAKVYSMLDLFGQQEWPLALDTYQRGFVWGEDKVNQLIADLLEYQAAPAPKPPYYMGTVLVHEHASRNRRFVVDGQQRLTALSVLYHAVTGQLPGYCKFDYSPQSAVFIQAAAKACRVVAPVAGQPSALGPDVFGQICFTVVTVRRLDLAFTFFDTQNNRGVQLHATDLLKAFHLRAIDGATEAQQTLQRRCAARWEALQRGKQVLTHKQERVQTLFARLLWRARRWTGQHAWEAGHSALLEEFEGPAWARLPRDQAHRVPLYAARTNLRAAALSWADDDSVHYETLPASPFAKTDELPFAIRQPIHPGASFFLYADRYAALLARLTDDESADPEVLGFREILNTMVAGNSLFLQEAFLLVGLMYADRFGSERLEEFALWLEHALGAVRMEKLQVRQETAQKFFREDSRMSLTDVVANAYHPQQAIDHVRSMADRSYDTAVIDMDGGGVQAVYQRAVLGYFGREATQTLGQKRAWIVQKTAPKTR